MPLPKVRGIAEEEMFKVVKTGKKTAKKGIPISCFQDRTIANESFRMEAYDYKANFRRARLHQTTRQV